MGKCELMYFNRRNQNGDYLRGAALQVSEVQRDRGVLVHESQKASRHESLYCLMFLAIPGLQW